MNNYKPIPYQLQYPSYSKSWGICKLKESHKENILFSCCVHPGFPELLQEAILRNSDLENLYVVCPQYSTIKFDEKKIQHIKQDLQYVVTGKAFQNSRTGTKEDDEIYFYSEAKREIAEETGLDIDYSNMAMKIKAHRIDGRKGKSPISVFNYYCCISPKTKLNTQTTKLEGKDDATKKLQILVTGEKEYLLDFFSQNVIPLPSNDTQVPTNETTFFISGVRLISFLDLISFFESRINAPPGSFIELKKKIENDKLKEEKTK